MSIKIITSDNFEQEVIKSEETVLLDFYADWCMPCKMMAPILEDISNENDKVVVAKINIDEYPEKAEEYKVMSIPTMIIFKNGKETDRIIGAHSKDSILELF